MPALLDDYITESELAGELGIKPRTLQLWRLNHRGPAPTTIAKKIFYRRSTVSRWLEDQERKPSGAGERNKIVSTVRKRIWKRRSDGLVQEAWIVNYTDAGNKRRLKTFRLKREADQFQKLINGITLAVPAPLKNGPGPLQFFAPIPPWSKVRLLGKNAARRSLKHCERPIRSWPRQLKRVPLVLTHYPTVYDPTAT